MKKYIFIFAIILSLLSYPSFAAGTNVTVHVSGLVCDFCARALEKVFGQQESVSTVTVDLDKKIVVLDFKNDQSLDDTTITKLITDSGYNVVSIARDNGVKK